jgi:hypothetical protein
MRFWQQLARLFTVTRPTDCVAPRSIWSHCAAPEPEWQNVVPLVMQLAAEYDPE